MCLGCGSRGEVVMKRINTAQKLHVLALLTSVLLSLPQVVFRSSSLGDLHSGLVRAFIPLKMFQLPKGKPYIWQGGPLVVSCVRSAVCMHICDFTAYVHESACVWCEGGPMYCWSPNRPAPLPTLEQFRCCKGHFHW